MKNHGFSEVQGAGELFFSDSEAVNAFLRLISGDEEENFNNRGGRSVDKDIPNIFIERNHDERPFKEFWSDFSMLSCRLKVQSAKSIYMELKNPPTLRRRAFLLIFIQTFLSV